MNRSWPWIHIVDLIELEAQTVSRLFSDTPNISLIKQQNQPILIETSLLTNRGKMKISLVFCEIIEGACWPITHKVISIVDVWNIRATQVSSGLTNDA